MIWYFEALIGIALLVALVVVWRARQKAREEAERRRSVARLEKVVAFQQREEGKR